VTSVRAYWTMYGDFGGYNASKFGLRALTESVARQLHGTDTRITVGMISPGLVDTRITNPDGAPQPTWVQTETIADLVMHIVTGPDHVNYFDSIVFPIEQTPW
jgi:NADP-dependent 3-hydroxy acid dehydrogenase YdfG